MRASPRMFVFIMFMYIKYILMKDILKHSLWTKVNLLGEFTNQIYLLFNSVSVHFASLFTHILIYLFIKTLVRRVWRKTPCSIKYSSVVFIVLTTFNEETIWNKCQSCIRPSICLSLIVKSRLNHFLEQTSTEQWG